ncbi:peptidoglycan-binding protein [Pararhodobacter sp. SW119]|uniref:peptidoglycan-binding domain-containing protein n=1 Tax=Pararhodobacter sp. SW119 TaxID=2780075 RepID=UPI001ADF40F7|nr:peptidoglycan-binding protein [Pararhodobacter sp. SW119]
MLRAIVAIVLFLGGALPATAAGLALILANEDHAELRPVRGIGDLAEEAAARLESAGFAVSVTRDATTTGLRDALAALEADLRDNENPRVVIVLAGHFVHAGARAWLLGTEAAALSPVRADGVGLRLGTVLALAGARPGGAIVALAESTFPGDPGQGLIGGLPAAIEVPQGVTLVRGPAGQIAGFLRAVGQPGTRVEAALAQGRALRAEGFLPAHLPFLPADFSPGEDAERRAWEAAEAEGTEEALIAFLENQPEGRFAARARAALEAQENAPERIEAALGLSRDERRAIQRDLTLLGRDTRGIDGIFGPGTRGAIRNWQRANEYADTGYLDRDQIFRLAAQSARRAAELEAEARERQVEIDRQDRAYWRDTGAGADEAGLRAYLDRFPDGLFATIARDRLAGIEGERQAAAQARDRAAWDAASDADSPGAYRRYLEAFPQGAFVEAARDRLDALTGRPGRPGRPDPDAEAIARANEEALGLPRMMRNLIERRLDALGHDPGLVDGEFDADTRRAIRRYQRSNDLPVTGYVTEQVVSRLLMGAILPGMD